MAKSPSDSPTVSSSVSPVLLEKLAKEFGTPLYVYDENKIAAQYRALDDALSTIPHQICYAVKANSNLTLLRLLGSLGAGFDIVSEGELRRVITAQQNPRQVVFAGVAKTQDEIRYALQQHVRFLSVESLSELQEIGLISAELGMNAPVAIRLNPDVPVTTHPYLATGMRTSKFGINEEELPHAWEIIRSFPSLSLVGITCHIGCCFRFGGGSWRILRQYAESGQQCEDKGDSNDTSHRQNLHSLLLPF